MPGESGAEGLESSNMTALAGPTPVASPWTRVLTGGFLNTTASHGQEALNMTASHVQEALNPKFLL